MITKNKLRWAPGFKAKVNGATLTKAKDFLERKGSVRVLDVASRFGWTTATAQLAMDTLKDIGDATRSADGCYHAKGVQ